MTIQIDMVSPSWASGDHHATGWQRSGTIYTGVIAGSTISVDVRDVSFFQLQGFVTTGSPSES
jgi:hypothetical protein